MLIGPGANGAAIVADKMQEAIKMDPDMALLHAICPDKLRDMAAMGDYVGIGKYIAGIIDGLKVGYGGASSMF